MPEIPQDVAQRATAVQEQLNQKVAATKSDHDLTPEGRTRRLAAAYLDAMSEMEKVQEGWSGNSVKTATDLTRQVFGASKSDGADAISARDASDRASQLEDPQSAMNLLSNALLDGDTVLARAVALRAFQHRDALFGAGWDEVVQTYAKTNPDVAEQIEAIAAAKRNDLRTGMAAAMTFSLHRPSEIERYSDTALQRLAGGAA